MKLKLALASLLITFGASTAQAADTRTPDILSSVSAGSVQAMSKADSAKARGEYWQCTTYYDSSWPHSTSCGYVYSYSRLPYSEYTGWLSRTNYYVGNYNGIYVSR